MVPLELRGEGSDAITVCAQGQLRCASSDHAESASGVKGVVIVAETGVVGLCNWAMRSWNARVAGAEGMGTGARKGRGLRAR
jgi:hypothetical protein